MKWKIKMCIRYLLGHFKCIKLRLKHLFVHISVILGCPSLDCFSANLTWRPSCSCWQWDLFWGRMVQHGFTQISSTIQDSHPRLCKCHTAENPRSVNSWEMPIGHWVLSLHANHWLMKKWGFSIPYVMIYVYVSKRVTQLFKAHDKP